MAFLTLVIGVLNVCLGYALAVHLGYGPGGRVEPWETTPNESPAHERAMAFDLDGAMDDAMDDVLDGAINDLAAPREEAAAGSLVP